MQQITLLRGGGEQRGGVAGEARGAVGGGRSLRELGAKVGAGVQDGLDGAVVRRVVYQRALPGGLQALAAELLDQVQHAFRSAQAPHHPVGAQPLDQALAGRTDLAPLPGDQRRSLAKVNPVIPEVVNHVGFFVIVTLAA